MAGLRIAIIANPHAHRNRLWPLALQALRKAAPGAALFETAGPKELQQAARELVALRPRLVAIAGGDGTVQHTLTALRDASAGSPLPAVSLLGGGAFDSLAQLGGKGAPELRMQRLSEALSAGATLHAEERDTLEVAGSLGFRFGTGLPLRFVEKFYATGRRGRLTGALLLARTLLSSLVNGPLAQSLYQPMRAGVTVDGEDWPSLPLFGLLCASVAEGGLGLRPFRRATEQPGFFQVLGLTAGPRAFALELPRLLAGRPARRDRLLEALSQRVELRPEARAAFSWLLDGELGHSDGPLVIGVGPRVTLVHA